MPIKLETQTYTTATTTTAISGEVSITKDGFFDSPE